MPKRKKVEEIPEDFKTYEKAAEFWDTHDSTKYKDVLEEVKMEVDIRKRHYLVEMDKDVAKVLHKRPNCAQLKFINHINRNMYFIIKEYGYITTGSSRSQGL